ncbi:hypothetical protein EIP86_011467 [Pleurotus ostreatoroseus]|nr:hypothetical protein EIP86_011467 [Pleurotus ostreatoroseus]
MRIGLAQPNINDIEAMLMDVSHPNSPNYGKHWSAEKVAETFRASSESIDTVLEWLVTEGIHPSRTRLSKGGNWIEADVSVSEAEDLLKTKYYVYGHGPSGYRHIGCDEAYHLPEHVAEHVELVTPTLHFDVKFKRDRATFTKRSLGHTAKLGPPGFSGPVSPKTAGKIDNVIDELENCDIYITPNCLRALYNFDHVPVETKKNSIGIGSFPASSDITIDQEFVLNGESDLDLQYSMALVGKTQPVTLYQVGDLVEGEDIVCGSFNNLLDAFDATFCTFEGGDDPSMDGIYPDPSNQTGAFKGPEDCGTLKPASVISSSFALNEADLTPFYTARQCAEYAKLGLMGVTVLYSTGDHGVAGNNGACLAANGTQAADGKVFSPSFPAACPFVTSVGATQINPGAKVTDPESACMQVIFSGGGFSNHFKMPDYQKAAVEGFLTNHPPPFPPTIYNTSGSRAFPDISANGANYIIAVNGEFELVFGTSCSSPVSAAILSGINDARLAVGKGPIGFINPIIYSSSFEGVFNDITNGTNPGCGTEGFSAVKGWDPVTGLGTINFPKLLAKFLQLP